MIVRAVFNGCLTLVKGEDMEGWRVSESVRGTECLRKLYILQALSDLNTLNCNPLTVYSATVHSGWLGSAHPIGAATRLTPVPGRCSEEPRREPFYPKPASKP